MTKQAKDKLNLKIFLREELLEQNETTKFVGLIIDENLSWSKRVDSVVGKMSSGLFALQLAKCCNLITSKTGYFTLIQHSHLEYGISIYGSRTKKNLDRLLVQKIRSLRIRHIKWVLFVVVGGGGGHNNVCLGMQKY